MPCKMVVEGEIDILQQAGSHPNLNEFHWYQGDAQGILCLCSRLLWEGP
jgi:hypothetical protein